MSDKYTQVVLNPGRKGSYWDAGDSPMTISEWESFLKKKGEKVYRVLPLNGKVGWE